MELESITSISNSTTASSTDVALGGQAREEGEESEESEVRKVSESMSERVIGCEEVVKVVVHTGST